ncbi:FAD-dependent oxidoreductase [Kitasatospora acidiphila]|uniref:FAD-dependent oxidoreductase n=1 Tax=Kitasatospora acidiphila TaxID=2567942 RepID=A0A540VYV6_9ACTN|nr:FAD-dependent oxidoreductase [Kitasatospora acidiphila]TQF01945.1 FAD-dependent oxidoreductase [Kitasatospora acidiphila]
MRWSAVDIPSPHDLIIIGGGPAGCAAAVMAASVGMRSVLVEPRSLCHTLRRIPALGNVLGFTAGPALADAITADVHRSGLCEVLLSEHAEYLDADENQATVGLASGRRLTAPFAIVATGVRPAHLSETPWISHHSSSHLTTPPLWEADPSALKNRTVLVLGADRPLGTLLRAHPDLPTRLLVLHPAADDYKAEEARHDSRVELIRINHIALEEQQDGTLAATGTTNDGRTGRWPADAAFLNVGSIPATLRGLLATDASGYCPPDRQHPRVLTVGDLRSSRGQRIMIATGSGSEAALHAYYTTRLDQQRPGTPAQSFEAA